jgi:hypothetical protein
MKTVFMVAAAGIAFFPARSQEILNGSQPGQGPILFPADTAALEAAETRKDMDCTINPQKARLGFDMRFHSGYNVSIPLRELHGQGNMLTIVFRVTPKVAGADPTYMTQQTRVPRITEDEGEVTLQGVFDVGEGIYHVDWVIRDFVGRMCTANWDVDASLSPRDRQMTVAVPPHTIRHTQDEEFQDEPPVHRTSDAPIKVKVMLNYAPQRPGSAAIDPLDATALVSILRNLSRNPKIGKFSLVAFNVQEQRILYRQEDADHIDFPAMGTALKSIRLGTVDLNRLERKHGDIEFLSSLIRSEISSEDHLDGLIFVSPKTMMDSNIPQDDLKQASATDYPVFYMNYNLDPQGAPWKDAIGRWVKFLKGQEYTISGPRELWSAVTDVVARITKSRQSRPTVAPTGP